MLEFTWNGEDATLKSIAEKFISIGYDDEIFDQHLTMVFGLNVGETYYLSPAIAIIRTS